MTECAKPWFLSALYFIEGLVEYRLGKSLGDASYQVPFIRNEPNVIHAATMAPILYWVFESAVAVAL